MELRKEINHYSNIEIVRKLYPIVKRKILDFTDFWDNCPEKAENRHKELEKELEKLTNKDISKFNLWEYWEEEGLETLAFRISNPSAKKISDFTKEELEEIVKIIVENKFIPPNKEDDEILKFLDIYKIDYYLDLIKENFKNYNYKFFCRNKDKKGKYFTYSINEIVEKIWDK